MYTRQSYLNSPIPVEKEIKKLFKPSQRITVFDIGSCEGEDTVKYARLFPHAKIFSVEALPKNLPLVKENIVKFALEGRVTIIPFALSDQTGKARFYVSSGHPDHIPETDEWNYGNKSSSLLPPNETFKYHSWLQFNEVIEVNTKRLHDICQEEGIKEVDFIHMDVQGAELSVLQGADSYLEKFKAIWMEVEAVSLYEGQPLKSDVEKYMFSKKFFKIKDTVSDVSGDQLYLNSRYFPLKYLIYLLQSIWK